MGSVTYIKGALTPTNIGAVGDTTEETVQDAVFQHHLSLVIRCDTEDRVMKAKGTSLSGVETFINSLNSVLNTEGISELAYSGTLMVAVLSDSEPVITRVVVEEGAVTSEKAQFVWDEKVHHPYTS